MNTLQRLLTPRRLGYAWIAGGALWLAWLVSISLGQGYLDLARQVIGADYLQFYAAGVTLRQGDSARLYDSAFQGDLELKIIGPDLVNYYAFITPPFLAWLYAPLSILPYGWSLAAWSALGLAALWGSLKLLGAASPTRTWLWSLTWFPVFASITFGQNSLLSLLILSLACALWQREKGLAAGLAASLILYKPQLALGIGVYWLLEWLSGRKAAGFALLGLALGGGGLAALSFILLPEASLAYVDFARRVLPDLPAWQDFPLWHLHTLRGFWRLLLPGAKWLADGLTAVCALAGLLGFWQLWKRWRGEKAILFALAVCLTLWLTPHAMIYDWAILLVPAVIFWQRLPEQRPTWKALFALIWAATFFSSPLTFAQLKALPFAVQVSLPVLVFVFWQMYQTLRVPSDSSSPT